MVQYTCSISLLTRMFAMIHTHTSLTYIILYMTLPSLGQHWLSFVLAQASQLHVAHHTVHLLPSFPILLKIPVHSWFLQKRPYTHSFYCHKSLYEYYCSLEAPPLNPANRHGYYTRRCSFNQNGRCTVGGTIAT